MSSKTTQNYFSTKGIVIRNLPSSNLIYEVLKQRPGSCACTALKMKQDKTGTVQTCATDEGPCKAFTRHHMKENTNGPAVSEIFKTAKLFLVCSGR